ncbi:uncharacterized protein LOC113789179 isoform X2 [Dermatophagoides pteronyssinus]|uniref:uncharacterized protein LOC113789179 isoform X2 n=1 Tax=Dermatophagoides pteronyssinus TaxID=6956 RepID=UPI003F6782B0
MAKCINFSLELMRFLYRETTNIVLSPLSLEIAALSILSGVKNASFDEMRDSIFDMKISLRNINDFSSALKSIISEIKSLQDMEFKMYNFIYISSKYKLNEQYMNNVTKNLDTSLKLVNFEDTSLELYNMIDAEVSDATMGRINKVIQNVPTVSNMLLINSTTLQVNESRQSISSATSSKQLKQLFKSSYEGRTSIATTTEYDKAMDISFSVHNGQFKYYHDNEQEGSSPRDIINQLSQNKLQSISKLMALKQLEIKIPIIKLKMNIDLAYVWQIIGIQKIFDQDEADFSGLSTNPKGLCLESIIFNSEISLNGNFKEKTVSQESSKSKSNSSSTNKKTGGKKSTTVLSVAFNRPFIYFVTCNIKEQRKVILFAGVVNNLIETN